MDALKQRFAVLRTLLALRAWLSAFGVLAAIAAVMVAASGNPGLRILSEMCLMITAVIWVGSPSTRVAALATWAGSLGIPSHARRLRDAQILLLGLHLVFAVTVELFFRFDLRALVVPFGMITLAVGLGTIPIFGVLLLALLIAGKTVRDEYWGMAFEPAGAALIVGIGVAVFVHWLRQPQRHQQQGAIASHSLADAAHEDVHASELDIRDASLESFAATALRVEPAGRVSARKFWMGMGFDPISSWKVTAYSLLFALLALAAVHALFGERGYRGTYLILSALVASAIFGRFVSMHEAWMQTSDEQSVLLLAPRWPQGGQLKIEFLRSLWSGLPGYAAVWIGTTAVTMAAGWTTPVMALLAGSALLVVTLSCVGLTMHYFARARSHERSTFAIAYLLLTAIGAGLIVLAWVERSFTAACVGFGLIVLPILPSIYSFWTRRLQFPVQPPSRPRT